MSSSDEKITFYDIKTRHDPSYCWSLNPWKARASLNYKGLDYSTTWTEYPDIKPTFKSLGIPPNDPGSMFEYSCPAAKFPDGTYVMESRKIAEKLDALYPEPSLRTDSKDVIDRTLATVLAAAAPLGPLTLPRVPEKILGERSKAYFYDTRKTRFGMPLQEIAGSELEGTAWEKAQPVLGALAALLKEDEGGPYVEGGEVGFADFVVAGFMAFLKVLGEEDLFGRVMRTDRVFEQHWAACERWFQKDG